MSKKNDKIKNPETGRTIKIDGRAYKNLLKKGYRLINGTLIKNKSSN